LDEIIYFRDLGKEEILKIVDLELVKTLKRGTEIGYNLTISDNLKEHLVTVGYDPKFGARPLKRAIQRWIDDTVTEYIIENNPKQGTILNLDHDKENDVSFVETKKRRRRKEEKEE
jgi:ATP-dependent Clp protease ATP-binding subunit ClpC